MKEKLTAFIFAFMVLAFVQMFAMPNQTMRGAWCGFGVERYCTK